MDENATERSLSMLQVTLSGQPEAELKSIAEPFVDTPESLLARLIHEEVLRRGVKQGAAGAGDVPSAIVQDPALHESLLHTKLAAAWVDGRELPRPKWNGLLQAVHVVAAGRLGSFEAV